MYYLGLCILKDRQYNDKKKKDKRTNNDLQNNTHKTRDLVTRTPLKTVDELGCSGEVAPAPHIAPIVLFLLQTGDKA